MEGTARIVASGEIELNSGKSSVKYSSKEIVIATGSKPVELPFLPYDGKTVVNSDHGIAFGRVPRKMAVIGAGAIGLELGCVWSRLGSDVEIVEFLPEICPQLDPEMSKVARRILEKQGLSFRLETKVASAKIKKDKATLTLQSSKGSEELTVDRVLVAVGRGPCTDGLGLADAGVATDDHGRVRVDHDFQTNLPGVRAIGGVIHGPMLAHKAEEDGVACAEILASQSGL